MNQKICFLQKKKDDCNIFNHLFAIHIIIKSQGLVSFLNLCVFVMMASTQLDDAKYSAGVFVNLKKSLTPMTITYYLRN